MDYGIPASLTVMAVLLTAGLARAQTLPAQPNPDTPANQGIALYGTIDIGVAYQSKGAPISSYWGQGLEYGISKNQNRPQFSLAPGGLGQSRIGLRGLELLTDDIAGVFRLETNFNPQSGQLADGAKSLVANANLPLASQTANSDSTRKGQAFAGAAYAGVTSKTFGTLTFGRQPTPLRDDIQDYDPQGGAYAFSLTGFSGVTAGGGDTEDNILDNQIKWVIDQGPLHAAAAYQVTGEAGFGKAYQADLGGRYAGLSVDALYSTVKDALSVAALSTTQTMAAGYPTGSLTGTLSDNQAYTLNASYVFGSLKGFAGWEQITFENPSHVPTGGLAIDGFQVISDAGYNILVGAPTSKTGAYNRHRVLDVTWAGLSYAATSSLDLRAGWYHYDQNNYNFTGSFAATITAVCTGSGKATSSSKCAGTENAYSLVADYRVSKHFDLYGGAMFSSVTGGLASGFLATSTIDPTVGVRLTF